MKILLTCTECRTKAELSEDSDPTVDLAAFCLAWMRGQACRCAGFALDAPAPVVRLPPALRVVT